MHQAVQFQFKKLNHQLTSAPSPTTNNRSDSESYLKKYCNDEAHDLALTKNKLHTTDVNHIPSSSSTQNKKTTTKERSPELEIHPSSSPSYINRLLIADRKSSLKYLIDTGADVSIIPPSMIERSNYKNDETNLSSLFAANGSIIKTYGEKRLELNLGLRRSFTWTFKIADVKQPIIGADFIMHYKLLIDLANDRLIDETTLLATIGSVIRTKIIAIKAFNVNKEFDRMLEEFPEIVNPNLKCPSKKSKTLHYIETKGPPTFILPRWLAPHRLSAAKAEFQSKIRNGQCSPSKSSWASALYMERKPDGDYRYYGDYRSLNRVTFPDRYPIPYIQDFTNNLHGNKYFSKIDLINAFGRIEVHPDDIKKTAITTPFGLFEFNFMTYGLRNASQTIQRFMHEVTEGLQFLFVNIDEILVFSTTAEEHKLHLKMLFSRLREYGLQINQAKCLLGQSQVEYLGFLVTKNGIHPLPARVSAITNSGQLPEKVNQLETFLETIKYYHRFIPKAVENQVVLQKLISGKKKNSTSKIQWTEELRVAFGKCKSDLAENTLLVHPVRDAELSLDIDASQYFNGATLNQVNQGQKQPLGFLSQKLSPAETKYSTYDRELLAMYKAVKHFRYMLEGRYFYIHTDHEPLTTAFIRNPEKASPRQLRHLDLIGQYTTDIRHSPGKNNDVSDFLSRIQNINDKGDINFEILAEAQESDQQLQSYLKEKEGTSLNLKVLNVPNSTVKIYCDVSQETVRPFVPTAFRQIIMNKLHGLSHPGTRATTKLISQRFVWHGIRMDCAKFVQACIVCQRSKIHRHSKALMTSCNRPAERFEHIHFDLVGPLLPSNGYTYVLVFIDRFTRWTEAIPLFNIRAITIAKALALNWIPRFGVPVRITTNQSRQFESELFVQLNHLLGTNHLRNHPQTNAIMANWHGIFKASIMCHNTSNWFDKLPVILLGMRSVLREDIQATPAEMVYGTTLRLPGEFFHSSKPCPNENEFVKEFRTVMSQIAPNNASNHSKANIFVQENLSTCTHVFIRNDSGRASLQPPYEGPFEVLKRNNKCYKIQLKNRKANISIDRLKAAFIAEPLNNSIQNPSSTQKLMEIVTMEPKKRVTINTVSDEGVFNAQSCAVQ